jgi:hypothetical protein
LSATSQEPTPEFVTSATPQMRKMNAEVVTTMTTSFLKRLGHKSGLKPKRVSLEGEVYTVEVETKKFTAIVQVSAETREIKEYDVQPKTEESFFASFSPKTLLIVFVISAIVNVGLYFGFKALGL